MEKPGKLRARGASLVGRGPGGNSQEHRPRIGIPGKEGRYRSHGLQEWRRDALKSGGRGQEGQVDRQELVGKSDLLGASSRRRSREVLTTWEVTLVVCLVCGLGSLLVCWAQHRKQVRTS